MRASYSHIRTFYTLSDAPAGFTVPGGGSSECDEVLIPMVSALGWPMGHGGFDEQLVVVEKEGLLLSEVSHVKNIFSSLCRCLCIFFASFSTVTRRGEEEGGMGIIPKHKFYVSKWAIFGLFRPSGILPHRLPSILLFYQAAILSGSNIRKHGLESDGNLSTPGAGETSLSFAQRHHYYFPGCRPITKVKAPAV